jgi:outer membrane lipoprotein-sorting protein
MREKKMMKLLLLLILVLLLIVMGSGCESPAKPVKSIQATVTEASTD